MSMKSKQHWERIYATKAADGVSWFQKHAEKSLQLIQASGATTAADIIDVGGGASTLVDDLLSKGYEHLTVLDISAAALEKSRIRLGEKAASVHWLEGDITQVELPTQACDIWHDRAVFHFLTDAADRQAYLSRMRRALKPGGHAIIATFAEDGPQKCSGLPVVRYSPAALQDELSPVFKLLEHLREEHHTPFGTRQKFVYCLFRKQPE